MRIKTLVHTFLNEEDGAILSVGLLFSVPILLWAFLSTFVYVDAFRAELIANKASETIADMFSREENAITDDYMDGAVELLALLTGVEDDPDLRVTVLWYDEPNNSLEVSWSLERGYGSTHTTADVARFEDAIPIMADLDRVIIVETHTEYTAPISYAMGPFTSSELENVEFDTFTVTKPRFTPNFCYDALPNDDTNTMDC